MKSRIAAFLSCLGFLLAAPVPGQAVAPAGHADVPEAAPAAASPPRSVRDFFERLPQDIFRIEGCWRGGDCARERRDYVERYLEIEDARNGYWRSGCDGAQSCLRMALFKRPDGRRLVAVHTLHEADEHNYFLDYRDGQWFDVSAELVPEYGPDKVYELPRHGTTIQVFAKRWLEKGFSERGDPLYRLIWRDGLFRIER